MKHLSHPSSSPPSSRGNPRGDQVAAWLHVIGQDRVWLASQVGAASRHTVDKWFGPKGHVPDTAWRLIQQMMGVAPDDRATELSLDEYHSLQQLAGRLGTTVYSLCLDYIRAGLERAEESRALRIAEGTNALPAVKRAKGTR